MGRTENSNYAGLFLRAESALHAAAPRRGDAQGPTLERGSGTLRASRKLLSPLWAVWNAPRPLLRHPPALHSS